MLEYKTYEFAGWGREAKYVFKREPADAASLDDGKVLVVCSEVTVFVDTGQWRHRVDCHRDRRHHNEQHRYDRQHLTNNIRIHCIRIISLFRCRKKID